MGDYALMKSRPFDMGDLKCGGITVSRVAYPSSEKLRDLLADIERRKLALPDFQRDFVWDPQATEELIESICRNFPAGSLLQIRNSAGFYFAPREVAGAPELDGHSPDYLILDGQQRLTSLYQALYGRGHHRYFANLQAMIDEREMDECIFCLRSREAARDYGSVGQQAAALVFPLQQVFGEGVGFERWLDQIIKIRPEEGEEGDRLKEQLRDVHDQWLRNLADYEFPMVTLDGATSAEAVCTIFETLNRTGVKLSVFDLLTARFWPEDVRLRDLWDRAQHEHPIITDFEIDPYYVLQSIALFTAVGAPDCRRGDVLKLKTGQIQAGWDRVVAGLALTLQILRDDCGVVLPRWLPYFTMLIPAAAAMAAASEITGPQIGAVRSKLQRWFWCSVFGQSYESSPNSQCARDYPQLRAWFEGGPPPQSVADFRFDPALLQEITPRQRAVYRGVIALILRNGARDFHYAHRITAAMITEKKMDDHHIFPKAFLHETRPNLAEHLRECVLNRTLIDKETNQRISGRAPSDYLEEVSEAVPSQIGIILQSHLLPDGEDSAIWRDCFEDFLHERQSLLSAEIVQVTS